MNPIKALIPAAALLALAGSPALAAEADLTKVDTITCLPDRTARCKNGQCTWKDASARAKQELLVIDFKAKTAAFQYQGKNRGGGIVFDDKVEDGKRHFVISKDETRNPRTTMTAAVDKAGKLTLDRGAGSFKAEGTCKAS